MNDYAFFLLLGTGAGAMIAALALGLVITFQGSGVVNFAFGAMTMWVVYVYADLREGAYPFPIPGLPDRYHFDDDVGFAWALTLALLTAALLGLIVYFLVFRPLDKAPALAKVVASVGLLVMFTTLVERRFEKTNIRVSEILPREPVELWDGVTVPRTGLWLAAITLIVAGLLWGYSRFTRLGLVVRASAENEKGAILLGYSPTFLAAFSFVLASVVSGFIAILFAPMIQLSSTVFTFGYLIPAIGAALVGSFRYIVPTVATGLAIGMVQSSFTKLQVDLSWFPDYGAREGLPFLVIIFVMVMAGEKLPSRESIDDWKLPTVPPARVTPASVAVPVTLAIAGLVFLGPLWRAAIMTTVIATVLALSFVVLSGFAGQTSLAQLAFSGVAGFSLSKLAIAGGVPFPFAPLLAALLAAAFGVLVGLPVLRLRGTNLAIVTLAGGVAIAEFLFKNPNFVGDASTGGAQIPNPSLGGWDFGLVLGTKSSRPVFGIFLVVVTLVLALLVAGLRSSGTGRRMLAVRSNERAASAVGINVVTVRLLAFAISAFIAGVAGTLIGYRFGAVSDSSFGVIASLTAIAVAYLGGVTSVSGAVTAGVVATSGIAFFATSRVFDSFGAWEVYVGGIFLILTAILNPEGIAGGIRTQVAEARAQKEREAAEAGALAAKAAAG